MEETDIAGGFPLLLRHPGVLWTVPAAGALCPALASSLETVIYTFRDELMFSSHLNFLAFPDIAL